MVSKNNQWQHLQVSAQRVPHYGLRKLSVGVASVLLSTTLYMGVSAHADTVTTSSGTSTPATSVTTPNPTPTETTGGTAKSSNSGTPSNSVSETPTGQGTPEKSGAGSGSVDSNGATPVQPAATAAPTAKPGAGDETPKVGSETPASNVTQKETVDSQWIIHYVNQADHKQELKDPTVITLQYTRTNTSQSDGTTKYGDWSYVPGSYKQTGTSITVNDSDNPVKQDNIDKDGENMDAFTITAMYPTITGYTMHNNINGTRLHDYLRNNDRQADTMSKDFYAEYDVAKERSVSVKFVDDQSFDPNVSGGKAQVGQAITLTGRDGDTVKVNVTVPDKYQLANGQQLPTTYTFTNGSGDVTIHLVHKVVQREATINVKLAMMTGVDIEGVDWTRETITQERWGQLGDKFNDVGPGAFFTILPSVEVGTLTGHVNYDVVDNSVVSLGDNWTTLNLGGRTYQLPNGTDVVNGVLFDSDDGSLGKPLREYYLKHYSIVNPGHSVDPDYATRPWHGYLSVNATNDPSSPLAEWNDLGLQGGLVGNESNALAKANGDRAATAVETTNKTIDVSALTTDLFSEQDGQLQATLPVPVVGVYIPYVEKTATRTINVTMPDGKTTTVKQTATLEKQVDFSKDAHLDWTTSEWSNYDVPTIPGYTASQSNVAKEAVTGTTEDQIVNITYTANPQTATVVYQTEDGTPVHTTTVNGQAGQTVKVSSEVPAGWKIINGKVPSEITFGPNGTPQTVVTIAHQHVTVDPDHPQNNGTKLPDNPDKTFSGVETNDLNKTITRTIKVTTPDGQTKTVAQTAKLTRTADVDEVTGEVTYGKWTTSKWSNYDVPTVPGYTASQNEVPATEVTGDMTDQTIDISYAANSQTIHINYVDSSTGKIVHTAAVTGKTGDTVNLNLTVPDKYQLADGQQLPTTYTFAAYNGDVTIDLTHKIVQREATVDVQLGLTTIVDSGVDDDDGNFMFAVTQTHWKQLDDEIKDSKNPSSDKVWPSVKIGTLTGHVDYDLVDNKVVSFKDDGTSLNSDGQTYQMPDGTDVVNGVLISSNDLWGKSFKEQLLKYHPDVDPDYVNRTWYGYLSVNATNEIDPSDFTGNDLQVGLVGNEPNALAKATGDQAATAVKTANKTIDSNWLNHNLRSSEFSEQDGQLRIEALVPLVGVYIPYVEKMATRTINIATPDGKTTSVKQTAILEKRIDFNKDAHPDWTTSEWTSYDVPVIPGYTASQSNVDKEAVTGTTKDQTVNITYTANPQTTTVVYQTEDGTPVYTTAVKGQTGQTVKVSNEVPAGWVIINGKVPSEITFGASGTPQTVVTIAHQRVTVDPDHPQNNGTKLPDNSGKTFSGVEANDLNKTITRTIKVTTPDGKTTSTKQIAKLTRNADVDEVTGEVTYGTWTTSEWAAYDVPSVAGYTPSQTTVAKESVTAASEDTTVEITYLPMQHQISVEYVDDDDHGKIVKTDQMTGKTDQTITVTPSAPVNYDLVDNGNRTYTVTSDDAQAVQIHVKHHQVTTSESKTVTRTINVHTPHDGVKAIKQTVELTRDVTTDQVTGKKTYGDWSATEWDRYAVPAVAGYVPSIEQVVQQVVNGTTTDQTIDVTYSSGEHTTHINYVDGDGNIVHTTTIKGQTDGTAQVPNETPAGWTVFGEPVPTELAFGPGGHADVTVMVDHQHVTVTPDNPKTSTDKLPDNPAKTYPNGVGHDDLNKTVTRTVKVTTPDGQTKIVTQTAKLTRIADVDEVTGKVTYGKWTTGEWSSYEVPVVPGYTASQNEVPAVKVTDDTKDQTVTVTYTANDQTTHINYVDGNGKIVHMTTITGKTDQTVKVPNEVPAGWVITGGQVPIEVTFGANGYDDVTVTVDHQHVMVTPDQPQPDGAPLPDNPSQHFTGVASGDLNKTITRTIILNVPGQDPQTITQTAKLTRTATVDEVTGTVTYGDWTTAKWPAVTVPVVDGYTASQSQIPAVTVKPTTDNQTVTVDYQAVEVSTTSTTTPEARPTATSHTSGAKPMEMPTTHAKVASSGASATPVPSAAKASQLPQTGADKVVSTIMTSLGLLMGALSAFVLGRKRKGKSRKA